MIATVQDFFIYSLIFIIIFILLLIFYIYFLHEI